MFHRLAITICLAGCAHHGLPPICYDGPPAYPVTTIMLRDGKTLVHRVGPECVTSERPVVGGGDGERTYSHYTLRDQDGNQLVEGLSFLSDPENAGEFASYYKHNDRLSVMASRTGNTILAVEDRSPTFPRRAYILFQVKEGKWVSREVRVEVFKPASGMVPSYPEYPVVVGLTDQHIELRAGKVLRRIEIDELQTRD